MGEANGDKQTQTTTLMLSGGDTGAEADRIRFGLFNNSGKFEPGNVISSATQLPAAAKSLGMKAPKALKAIKKTTVVLKNIPK